MKKLLFIPLLIAGFYLSAQTIPTTDSVRKFVDINIRNSAIQAFTNLRLNNVLKSLASLIDSTAIHSGATINLSRTPTGTQITITPSGGGTSVIIDSARSTQAGLLTAATWGFLDSLHRGLISLGGGSGTNNTNAGSGFRWINESTQATRTVVAGYGILVDSTTNLGSLTFFADSTTLFTAVRATIPGGGGGAAVLQTPSSGFKLKKNSIDSLKNLQDGPLLKWDSTSAQGFIVAKPDTNNTTGLMTWPGYVNLTKPQGLLLLTPGTTTNWAIDNKTAQVTMNSNTTLNITGLTSGLTASGQIYMDQDVTGGRLITLPGNSRGVVQQLGPNERNSLFFTYDGTSFTWNSAYQIDVTYDSANTSGFDSDALAYFTAGSIVDDSVKARTNDLIVALKAHSLWSKIYYFNPCPGVSALADGINAKSPGTYNGTFSSGWTHATSTGATPSGSSTYLSVPFYIYDDGAGGQSITDVNSISAGYYSGSNTAPSTDEYLYGVASSGQTTGWDNGSNYRFLSYGAAITSTTSGVSTFNKLMAITRTSSTVAKEFRDGTQEGTTNTTTRTSTAVTLQPFYFGALNNGGTVAFPTARPMFFSFIASGLSDTDMATFTSDINNYQTRMGR